MELETIIRRLRSAGCVFAEDEAAMLVGAASGKDLQLLVERREAGAPLEQILGWAQFYGRPIVVEPTVFVPRRRTELLVREGLRRAPDARVAVDLCCGSGALAALLAEHLPAAEVHATDIDATAVRCARRNVDPRHVHEGDLFAALPPRLAGRIDLVVANAPYVPTDAIALMPAEAREYEARVALDGGNDGLDLHRRLTADAAAWLSPSGWLLIETSAAQAERTAGFASAGGLRPEIVRCEELDATAVAAQRLH